MENGAHFYRCDFQVHTPRDITWQGPCPTSEDERNKYAEDFIAACRHKALHAVGITDHHDVVFLPYIKRAAQNERDDAGNPIPENERIIIFPGMELTLGVPCQAILLLDASFPSDLLSQIPTILAVTPNDASAPKHANTTRLEHIKSISELHRLLDEREWLKGRYIILPNVGENGDFSLLRKGFASHYKEMPCVGGYIDGSVEKLKIGNSNILQGKAKEYGFKRLAVFQTSDNRKADFSNLGRDSSWVKWAVPTAEALRQACLAQDTRISNSEPQLPSLIIQSMEVSNSKFLGPINITFNPQFNSLIGGRGTGKSTILEYLRWALCDQPPSLSDEDEIPDFQKKRATLIENTLAPVDGVVTVTFLLNKIAHVVRRNGKTKHLLLKIGSGEFEDSHEEMIRDLLPVQAYSQKQLSTVGVRTDELVRFVKTPINKNLREFRARQDEVKARLRTSYLKMQAKLTLAREIERDKLEINSLNQQVMQLRLDLKGLSDDDQKILTQHDFVLQDEYLLQGVTRAITDWRLQVSSIAEQITLPPIEGSPSEEKSPNEQLTTELRHELTTLHTSVQQAIQTIGQLLAENAEPIQRIRSLEANLTSRFTIHNEKYEAAKARSTAQQSQLTRISDAERRIRTLRENLSDKERQLARHGTPLEDYTAARNDWSKIHADRADALELRCTQLTQLSANRIRARLRRAANLDNVRDRLSSVLAGTRVRTKKVDDLCDRISSTANPIDEWNRILLELEQLASLEATGDAEIQLPLCPLLNIVGFSGPDLDKIARRLSVEEWLEISLLELDDIPVFEYQQREADYIDFSLASAGQQATALLRVLLAQEGPPLIIDQPEEDLDNPIVLEIVKDIWKAKTKRQIIFSSHNANLVVNGDADLVICCDYRTAGDQSGGQIKARGAIDMNEIRNEITTIMEGGKEAFRLRKEKYGF